LEVEDQIVRLRKTLTTRGLDARARGPISPAALRRHLGVSVATFMLLLDVSGCP
jgi:hypothetical protein